MAKTISRVILVAIIASGGCRSALAAPPVRDNFNAPELNKRLWMRTDLRRGSLNVGSGKLNFSVAHPSTGDDYGLLRLRNIHPSYNENWDVRVDVSNAADVRSEASVGFWIQNAADPNDMVFFELYSKENNSIGGFNVITITDDDDNPGTDMRVNPGVSGGSIRVSFSRQTKLMTFWYDASGSVNGYQWTKIGTFSTRGVGGTTRGNWKMNPARGKFNISLMGLQYAERYPTSLPLAPQTVSLDNFFLKIHERREDVRRPHWQ